MNNLENIGAWIAHIEREVDAIALIQTVVADVSTTRVFDIDHDDVDQASAAILNRHKDKPHLLTLAVAQVMVYLGRVQLHEHANYDKLIDLLLEYRSGLMADLKTAMAHLQREQM